MKRTKRQKALPAKTTRMPRKRVSQAKVSDDAAAASAQTSGHRTAMMGRATTNLSASSIPAFSAVSNGKLLVGNQALMRPMDSAHRIWSEFWFQQMRRSYTVLPQLAGCCTPTRLMQVTTDSINTYMSDLVAFWMKATNFSESVADAGAKLIHRSVVADAKRQAEAT